MVVIHPKLDICWSYVAIYMYMTNILIVVDDSSFRAQQVSGIDRAGSINDACSKMNHVK